MDRTDIMDLWGTKDLWSTLVVMGILDTVGMRQLLCMQNGFGQNEASRGCPWICEFCQEFAVARGAEERRWQHAALREPEFAGGFYHLCDNGVVYFGISDDAAFTDVF